MSSPCFADKSDEVVNKLSRYMLQKPWRGERNLVLPSPAVGLLHLLWYSIANCEVDEEDGSSVSSDETARPSFTVLLLLWQLSRSSQNHPVESKGTLHCWGGNKSNLLSLWWAKLSRKGLLQQHHWAWYSSTLTAFLAHYEVHSSVASTTLSIGPFKTN